MTENNQGHKKQKKKKMRIGTITFRPDVDVDQLLDDATQATGHVKSQIILKTLKEEVPNVVRRIISEQTEARKRFEKGEK